MRDQEVFNQDCIRPMIFISKIKLLNSKVFIGEYRVMYFNVKFVECRSIEKNTNMNEPSENSIRNISFKHVFKGLIQIF